MTDDDSQASLLRRVLDSMPSAVFVMDELGTITLASERACALVGKSVDQIEGSSVLEFVDPDAAWAYAAAMDIALSDPYRDSFAGPVRISVLTAAGTVVGADLWTANRLDDPLVRGLVCELTPETASLGIAEAIAQVATGRPFDEVAATAAEALGGYPVAAHAAVLAPDGDGFRIAACHGIPLTALETSVAGLVWGAVTETDERVLFGSREAMPAAVADLAAMAGYLALWAEPVRLPDGPLLGVLVVGRFEAGEPTPNELSHVHQVISVLALADLHARHTG